MRILALLAFMVTAVLVGSARAAQIIPTGIEYTNDTIEQGGQLQACVVSAAIISPPAPEIVNFQLLAILGRPAFKVAASDVDWAQRSSVAKRISEAQFDTATFTHPTAFKQAVTPEGQLLAVLVDQSLRKEFIHAFFSEAYSIRFRRADLNDERDYYVEKRPSTAVLDKFTKCVHQMAQNTER